MTGSGRTRLPGNDNEENAGGWDERGHDEEKKNREKYRMQHWF
jgi:hypothetical protein